VFEATAADIYWHAHAKRGEIDLVAAISPAVELRG
jgi:hypothetical protein